MSLKARVYMIGKGASFEWNNFKLVKAQCNLGWSLETLIRMHNLIHQWDNLPI